MPGHARDMDDATWARAIAGCARPDLLRLLCEASRSAFGFYTAHFPHTINYPWVVERLETFAPGARFLDVGSGVSPVPLVLAARGMRVDCVDNHRTIRTLPAKGDWNEWGFFDYGALHPGLTSHHCPIAEYRPPAAHDAIYSISVLAHMPRAVREDALKRCAQWLRPGGRLLLAIDLIPSSDFLWNRCEGQEVEPPAAHGTADDVVAQLVALGFADIQARAQRAVYQSRTDLLFIDAIRPVT